MARPANSRFKAEGFLRLFDRVAKREGWRIGSLADVGCGAGYVVRAVAEGLRREGHDLARVRGFDIDARVEALEHGGVEFVHGDFCKTEESFDLVTLFDVFEHVPDTIEFLRNVGQRAHIVGCNIPLDDCLNVALRNRYRPKLRSPGHLMFLDTAAALNLLAWSGLTVLDYEYLFTFRAPEGVTPLQRVLNLPRSLLATISPWLLSKTLGGTSLLVVALTPRGLRELRG